MKKKELDLLRKKEIKELSEKVRKDKLELTRKVSELRTGGSKNIKVIRNLKKDIAQTLTLIKEKQLLEILLKKTEKVSTKSKK